MLSDNYPVGMSECDQNGIMGNCGSRCRVLERGDCDIEDELLSDHGVEAREVLEPQLYLIRLAEDFF
jgi:hypothetical protein